MSKLTDVGDWVEDRLPALLLEHLVPGAAIAVSVGGEVVEAASGVLSEATGVEATVDSVFQIGSITKVWTATLAMQLVDEGLLALDAPVRTYVPGFTIGDDAAAETITVRQLMCHTSGFEGDIFTDTGWGDDCLERYVAVLVDVPQLLPPGEMFSYNNAGYSVLGRVIEVLRGRPYDRCLREQLFEPLKLAHAATAPWEAILHRAAVGHIQPMPDARPVPAPVWSLMRSNAPAGAMLAMCPRDLLAFARMHLSEGNGPDGAVLSPLSVKAMQQRQVELSELGMLGDGWGLGWELFDLPGGSLIGHDGGTVGQAAFLRLAPERGVSVAVLTNGGNAIPVYAEVVGRVLRDLASIELPPLPVPGPNAPPVDADRYVGTYSSSVSDSVVSQDREGRLWLERTPKGILADIAGMTEKTELVGWRGHTLLSAKPEHGMHRPHAFVGDDESGRAMYLHTGRADRRQS